MVRIGRRFPGGGETVPGWMETLFFELDILLFRGFLDVVESSVWDSVAGAACFWVEITLVLLLLDPIPFVTQVIPWNREDMD